MYIRNDVERTESRPERRGGLALSDDVCRRDVLRSKASFAMKLVLYLLHRGKVFSPTASGRCARVGFLPSSSHKDQIISGVPGDGIG